MKVSSSSQEKVTTNKNQGNLRIDLLQYILKFDFAEQLGLLIYMPYNSDPPAFINLFKTREFIMFTVGTKLLLCR